MESTIIIGYWSIRGLAEPIRHILEYTGTPYSQKKYTTLEEWSKDKVSLGLEIPNVPYLIDGDKNVTESDAIIHYIILKSGHKELLGKTDDEIVNLAIVRGVLYDIRGAMVSTIYNPDYSKLIDAVLKDRVHPKLENLEKFSASRGGDGLIGTGLTYIDFVLHEVSQALDTMEDKVFDKYPTLKKIVDRVHAEPKIQEYLASDRFQARPFNNFSAAHNPK